MPQLNRCNIPMNEIILINATIIKNICKILTLLIPNTVPPRNATFLSVKRFNKEKIITNTCHIMMTIRPPGILFDFAEIFLCTKFNSP